MSDEIIMKEVKVIYPFLHWDKQDERKFNKIDKLSKNVPNGHSRVNDFKIERTKEVSNIANMEYIDNIADIEKNDWKRKKPPTIDDIRSKNIEAI